MIKEISEELSSEIITKIASFDVSLENGPGNFGSLDLHPDFYDKEGKLIFDSVCKISCDNVKDTIKSIAMSPLTAIVFQYDSENPFRLIDYLNTECDNVEMIETGYKPNQDYPDSNKNERKTIHAIYEDVNISSYFELLSFLEGVLNDYNALDTPSRKEDNPRSEGSILVIMRKYLTLGLLQFDPEIILTEQYQKCLALSKSEYLQAYSFRVLYMFEKTKHTLITCAPSSLYMKMPIPNFVYRMGAGLKYYEGNACCAGEIVSDDEFLERLNTITDGFIHKTGILKIPECNISGSIVSACLIRSAQEISYFKETMSENPCKAESDILGCYYRDYFGESDIDIPIKGTELKDVEAVVDKIIANLDEAKETYNVVVKSKKRITIEATKDIDVYCVRDVGENISNYHVAQVRAFYSCSEKQCYAYPTFAYAAKYSLSLDLQWVANANHPSDVMLKNSKRGFGIIVTWQTFHNCTAYQKEKRGDLSYEIDMTRGRYNSLGFRRRLKPYQPTLLPYYLMYC